jgi:putative ABC transport system substrate-binding protein
MRRRDFITLLGGAAAAWPLAASAQQPAVPVIGYLDLGSPEARANYVQAFRKGLNQGGYVEGRNLAIEYRFARDETERLPELVADLVRRRVVVIAATTLPSALVAKAATSTIPIVFMSGTDPIQAGLVTTFNHPGGNVTGVTDVGQELGAKRLGLLHELLPQATRFAALINRLSLVGGNSYLTELPAAASRIGVQVDFYHASTNREIDSAFSGIVQARADALLVSPQVLFFDRRVQIQALAARHAVPVIYPQREYVEAGGLMSYGSSYADRAVQTGVYVGRILKGEKPGDLPVMRAAKFEFLFNLQSARTIGIEVPPDLLSIADEVIE